MTMRVQKPCAEFSIGKNEHQYRMVMKSQGGRGLRTDPELDKGRNWWHQDRRVAGWDWFSGRPRRKEMQTMSMKVLVAQSCLTLGNSVHYSPPGSSVHEIPQARILEWVAISFSRGSSQPRD